MSAKKFKPHFTMIAFGLCVVGIVVILLLPINKEQEALAFFAVFPLAIVGFVTDTILVGEFGPLHGTGCRFSRSQTPVRFWAAMVLSLCLAAGAWVFVAFKWLG